MTSHSAVTIFAARFDRALGKGDDTSGHPKGATLFSGGTEVSWATEDGFACRDRTVRVWLTVWPNADLAQDHYDNRAQRIPLLSEAREAMAALCHPFACHGEVNWTPDGQAQTIYGALAPRPDKTPPILVMTSLGIGDPTDGLKEFGQGVTAVRQAFATNPDVALDINVLPDIPMIDGPTLTLWRSERAIMQGAYRTDPHRTTMKMRNGAMARASFTRMEVVAAEGTWAGVDLAATLADFRSEAM